MYSTLSDLKQAESDSILLQLSWDGDTTDSNPAAIDEDVIESAIGSGDAVIDGYLATRYLTPLTTVPELIRTISVDLALFFLYRRRMRSNMPESITKSYDKALVMLKDIAKGVVSLDVELVADVRQDTVIECRTRTKVYSSGYLDTY